MDRENIKTTSDAVEIQGYLFGKDELICPCGSHRQRIDYTREHEENGVTALALATECKDCGETSLHISY